MWKPGTARPGYGAGEESGISSSKYKGGNTHKKKSAKSTKSGGGGSGVLGKRARSSKPPPRVHDDSVPDELAVDEPADRSPSHLYLSTEGGLSLCEVGVGHPRGGAQGLTEVGCDIFHR